jgi:predicted alpha/beta-hydrolase family hydrolase
MITEWRNVVLQSKHQRQFLADVYFQPNQQKKSVIVFAHGFKGFKDWGAFNLAAQHFAAHNFVFVKFNFRIMAPP